MNDLPFKFPILTVPGLDPEKWWELVNIHADADEFTALDRRDLQSREEVGRVVMDATGNSWRILAVHDLGLKGSGLWSRFWSGVFGKHSVRYDVSDELHLPFDEIRESICTAIRAKPDSWRCDEAIAGEDGPPREEEEMLEELIGKVRKAKSPQELMAVISSWGED
jgi:hypothetical protein